MFAVPQSPPVPTLPGFALTRVPFTKMPDYLRAMSAKHGPIVRFRYPFRSIYFVDDAAMLAEVFVGKAASYKKGRGTVRLRRLLGTGLLTAEQPEHLRQRRFVQPAFHKTRIEACADLMVDLTRRRVAGWRPGETIEIDREAMHLALDIVATALFGTDLTRDRDAIGRALDTCVETFPFAFFPFSELFDNVPIPITRRFKAARKTLDEIVYRMIATHRTTATDGGDLLAMLLAHRDDDGAMTDRQIRDEALTILLAGHETTANAIAWTFYLLQRHPEIEARLHAHLDAVLGDRDPTLADLPQLGYVHAVFAEVLRLYPPVWGTARRALEATSVNAYPIARNDVVLVSQFVTHRNPRYWNEPDRFAPERWLVGAPLERFAYFPFGGGNRLCIGDRFAWMEGQLAVATIARRVRLVARDDAPVRTQPLLTLRPRTAIRARVESRARV
ncbi:MAG: cytochrome P450 [Vulcanimicrobiaceae bacterium]